MREHTTKHRHSIRLPDYDYSQAGAYFVTICTHQRECLFGEIIGEKMQLNNPGKMIMRWWMELETKYPTIIIDEFAIMPNHFHGIIVITDSTKNRTVGAALCGRPRQSGHPEQFDHPGQRGRPRRGAPTLGNIIGWLKTMTTNEYIRGVKNLGWEPFSNKVWQRNYYEHVIHNRQSLQLIHQYIINNPLQWAMDPDNPADFR